MALTNEQKASIARKAYADVAAGKPSPFKSSPWAKPQPQPEPQPKK